MSKIKKVTIEFDDKIMMLEGEEAEKWSEHNSALASLAYTHNMNLFDLDPVKWIKWKIEQIKEAL